MTKTNLEELLIRPARAEDFDELMALCERRLGAGYLSREDFEDRLLYPDLFLVADHNGRPVAAVTMTPEPPESLSAAVQLPVESIRSAASGKPTIHFRTAICAEDFEGSGLTRRLLSEVIANARRAGYGLILSPVWKYDGHAPAAGMHDQLGFDCLGERQNLWLDQEGYTCAYCKGPCRCEAILYQLKL